MLRACAVLWNLHGRIRIWICSTCTETARAQNMHTAPRSTLCATNFSPFETHLVRVLQRQCWETWFWAWTSPWDVPWGWTPSSMSPTVRESIPSTFFLTPSAPCPAPFNKGWQSAELSAHTVFGSTECSRIPFTPGQTLQQSRHKSPREPLHPERDQTYTKPADTQILTSLKAALDWQVSLSKALRISWNIRKPYNFLIFSNSLDHLAQDWFRQTDSSSTWQLPKANVMSNIIFQVLTC